jgi:hypothetical protein
MLTGLEMIISLLGIEFLDKANLKNKKQVWYYIVNRKTIMFALKTTSLAV